MGWKINTAPTTEPVTLSEAKKHLRITGTTDDTYVDSLIASARTFAENYMERALITQKWDLVLDSFPRGNTIKIPRSPLQTANFSIKYYDTAGVEQTWSSAEYAVDVYNEPGRVVLGSDYTWPVTQTRANAITIACQVGYGADADDVPELIRQGILILIAHWYVNRTEVTTNPNHRIPWGAQGSFDQYRVTDFSMAYG